MELVRRPMTDGAAREISAWVYGGEYAIYSESSYEEKAASGSAILDPEKRRQFTCFYLEDALAGYIRLRDEGERVIFGIGLRPDLCGLGYGQRITRQAIALSREEHPGKPLYLTVRSWNGRAIRCYEKAGFRKTGEQDLVTPLGPGRFVVMEAR